MIAGMPTLRAEWPQTLAIVLHTCHTCRCHKAKLAPRSEQSGNAIDVDTARAIFWSILKHASAVYNRIHPIEVRDP
jgi:hypothetical protein